MCSKGTYTDHDEVNKYMNYLTYGAGIQCYRKVHELHVADTGADRLTPPIGTPDAQWEARFLPGVHRRDYLGIWVELGGCIVGRNVEGEGGADVNRRGARK